MVTMHVLGRDIHMRLFFAPIDMMEHAKKSSYR